jgi:hypothetical protein
METQTRLLTIEEMYFNKVKKMHLPAPASQSMVNTPLLKPGVLVHANPIQQTPAMDLSKPVFPPTSFHVKAMKFINEHGVLILLLGTALVTGAVLWNRYQQKKKNNSQG